MNSGLTIVRENLKLNYVVAILKHEQFHSFYIASVL